MQHRNTFTGGMKSGTDYQLFPQDSYTYLLNGCIISKDKHGFAVRNIKGNVSIAEFGPDEVPIGSASFNNILYIITHYDDGESEPTINFFSINKTDGINGWEEGLGRLLRREVYPNLTITSELSIPVETLGFTKAKLLEVFAKESYDGSVDLYICDGLNPNVVVNTGLDSDGKFTERFYENLTSPSLFRMQKIVEKTPTATGTVRDGGNMKPGTYFIYIRYEDDSLNPTPFVKELGPFFIHSGVSSNNTASGSFNENERRVDKQIFISISNADPNYKRINLGVVYYYGENSILSTETYRIDKSYLLTNNRVDIIFDGNNKISSLIAEELFRDNLRYTSSETHIQLENRYYGANWSSTSIDERDLIELSKLFIPYATVKDRNDFDSYYDQTAKEFEYMEDEIYPLGVSFLINGQYKTDVFPIFGWFEGQSYTVSDRIVSINDVPLEQSIEIIYKNNEYKSFTILKPAGITINIGDTIKFSTPGLSSLVFEVSATSEIPDSEEANFSIQIDSFENYQWDLIKINQNQTLIYDNPSEYTSLKSLVNTDKLPWFDNTKSLYKFPRKEQMYPFGSSISTNIHFKKMGLAINDSLAKAHLALHPELASQITEVYFVQGKRKENTIFQGVINPMVESIGFIGDYNYFGGAAQTGTQYFRQVAQATWLGNGQERLCFPYMDTINLYNFRRRFPVMKINRFPLIRGDNKRTTWDYQENAVTEMNVLNPNVSDEFYDVENERVSPRRYSALSGIGDLDAYTQAYVGEKHYGYFHGGTRKFCIYSPDILMRNIDLKDKIVHIKHIGKIESSFTHKQHESSAHANNSKIRYQTISCSLFSLKPGGTNWGRTYNQHLENTTYIDLYHVLKRYMNPVIGKYSFGNKGSYRQRAISNLIDVDIINGWNGFSSRMKSIPEVYGDDMRKPYIPDTSNDEDEFYQSSSLNQYFMQSRDSNMKAGIIINKVFRDHPPSKSGIPLTIDGVGGASDYEDDYRVCRFSCEQVLYADNDPEKVAKRALPVVVSSLSMKSTPYLAVLMDNNLDYSWDSEHNLFCNSIVNVCKYDTIDGYVNETLNYFDWLSETFSIIGSMSGNYNSWNNSFKAWKGDLFSQKTFMRTVRWSHHPDSMSAPVAGLSSFEYAWKQGQAFNIYLQSFCNTYLRNSSFDETFMPYYASQNSSSTADDIQDYIWRSTDNKVLHESWNSNAGYHQLSGILKLSSFNELFLRKTDKLPTRIYYSGKQLNGAFVDAYRDIPLLQYKDYSLSGGEILKLAVFNSSIFSIQKFAILQHHSTDRLEKGNDSSYIIFGDKDILAEETLQLCDFGTQHKESVVVGDNGIYGVDWLKKRIWRIKPTTTATGVIKFGVEDLCLIKSLHEFFKDINPSNSKLEQNLYSNKGIISAFDSEKHEILFTFKQIGGGGVSVYKTLVFNEDLDIFTSYYSYNTNFYMQLDNRLFSFSKDNGKDLWEHNIGTYQKFYGTKSEPLELEFVVNCLNQEQNVSGFEKDFLSHLITACPEIYENIVWETEWQQSFKNPFVDNTKFWSNPEYTEDKWMIPILKSETENKGPHGTEIFRTFDKESTMKGIWLKVKIKYRGVLNEQTNVISANYFYLRNVVTNFLISYT